MASPGAVPKNMTLVRLRKEYDDLRRSPNPNYAAAPVMVRIGTFGRSIAAFLARGHVNKEVGEANVVVVVVVVIVVAQDNYFDWHFTIRGPPDTAFAGGIYHGRILLPHDFPFAPPNIMFLTPNGRFATNTKICLSISAHHPESWQPAWGIRLILEALISFMPTPGEGAIGALDTPDVERRRLAAASHSYCCALCGSTAGILAEAVEGGGVGGGGGGGGGSGGGGGGGGGGVSSQLAEALAQLRFTPAAGPTLVRTASDGGERGESVPEASPASGRESEGATEGGGDDGERRKPEDGARRRHRHRRRRESTSSSERSDRSERSDDESNVRHGGKKAHAAADAPRRAEAATPQAAAPAPPAAAAVPPAAAAVPPAAAAVPAAAVPPAVAPEAGRPAVAVQRPGLAANAVGGGPREVRPEGDGLLTVLIYVVGFMIVALLARKLLRFWAASTALGPADDGEDL